MEWTVLKSIEKVCKIKSETAFYDCIEVLINKPQVINRRLVGSQTVSQFCFDFDNTDVFTYVQENKKSLSSLTEPQETHDGRYRYTKRYLLFKDELRYPHQHEVIVQDLNKNVAIFITEDETNPMYGIQLKEDDCLQLMVEYLMDDKEKNSDETIRYYSDQWLCDTLLPSIEKWLNVESFNTKVTSLTCVSVSKYNEIYRRMKNKYANKIIESWPETTDPKKYVYEDISIAAYLITIWTETSQNSRKPSFVDVGCGNGLLVHLLNEEGYKGIGIDLRKRNIWNSYFGPDIILKEYAITPDNLEIFEGYDWLIGNHSDELTPWIPVIASRLNRSSHLKGQSPYQVYLEYIEKEVCQKICGFQVRKDVMRIPSTKRVCFICEGRNYEESDWTNKCEKISSILEQKKVSDVRGKGSLLKLRCSVSFKIRPKETDQTRNCSSCDSDLVKRIVSTVFNELLNNRDEERLIKLENGGSWDAGASIVVGKIVDLFDNETLSNLKKESGGMQTLLRNNHQVFQVSGGQVMLRNWLNSQQHDLHQQKKRRKRNTDKGQGHIFIPLAASKLSKSKLCYMFMNHPDSCPLTSELCRFAHGDKDLITIS